MGTCRNKCKAVRERHGYRKPCTLLVSACCFAFASFRACLVACLASALRPCLGFALLVRLGRACLGLLFAWTWRAFGLGSGRSAWAKFPPDGLKIRPSGFACFGLFPCLAWLAVSWPFLCPWRASGGPSVPLYHTGAKRAKIGPFSVPCGRAVGVSSIIRAKMGGGLGPCLAGGL